MQKQKQTNSFLKVLLIVAIGILLVSMVIAIAPTFEEESGYDKLIIVAELVFLILVAMVIFNLLGEGFLVNKREEGNLQLREIFENASSGLVIVALDGRFLKANHAFCGITGYENKELEQLTFKDITHPEDLDADVSYVEKLLDGSLSSYHLKKRYVHKNGEHVWINLWGSVIKDKTNKPLYLIGQVQKVRLEETASETVPALGHTNLLHRIQVPNILAAAFEPA
jgi:PAS domain S-box-containing protein